MEGICDGATFEGHWNRDLIGGEEDAVVSRRCIAAAREGTDHDHGRETGKDSGDNAPMSTNEAGKITASQSCEHPARLGTKGHNRKWLSTGQLVVLDGVEVLGAGVLGVEVLLEVEGVLLDVDDELEPPVFDFLSRESLR
jgi:hypothetical protein